MSTSAHYHPLGIDVDLADLPGWLYDDIASLQGQIDRDDPPVLSCLGNGASMYVWRPSSGKYFIKHFPGTRCGLSHAFGTMSDEHRRQAEYGQRAATEAGFDAQFEVSTGAGTRLDVGIRGTVNVGLEIQRSELTKAHAKKRASKSNSAGWNTAWIHDKQDEPRWAGHVPTARLSVRPAWDHMPPANTAKVIIRKFTRVRDHDMPGGWNYEHDPTEVLYDDLARRMPASEIIPVSIGNKGIVVLAHRGAAEIVDSVSGPGASLWRPTASTPNAKESASLSIPCRRHDDGLTVFCSVCGQRIDPRGVLHHDWVRGWIHPFCAWK